MTKMPLKGIRARLTRHGDSLAEIRSQMRDLVADANRREIRISKVVTKINDIVAYLDAKLGPKSP